jgi:CheY-like chemotaxis protein
MEVLVTKPNLRLLNSLVSERQLEKEAWARKSYTDQGNFKIAVIDDCEKTTSLIRSFLKDFKKAQIVTFNDEFDAIRSIAEDRPDLILMDIQLEVLNGYKLAHLLREMNCPEVPIIYMSQEHKLLKDSTFKLPKPLTKSHLSNYLESVLMKGSILSVKAS